MTTIRLTNELRSALKAFVVEKIDFPELDRAEKDTRKVLYAAIKAACLRQWPQADMKVLAKYEYAGKGRTEFYCLVLTDGRHVDPFWRGHYSDTKLMFPRDDFKLDLLLPNHGGSPRPVLDEAGTKAFDAWEQAKMAQTKAREAKHADYYTLIANSRTLDQVEQVWPAAKAIRKKLARSLPVIVLDDVIKRISEDQAARAAS